MLNHVDSDSEDAHSVGSSDSFKNRLRHPLTRTKHIDPVRDRAAHNSETHSLQGAGPDEPRAAVCVGLCELPMRYTAAVIINGCMQGGKETRSSGWQAQRDP